MSQPIVAIRGLHYRYPAGGQDALNGVEFATHAGERVGIIGSNGAGKTTLLLHIMGILRGNGEIWICGERLSRKTVESIREKIGMVFQDPRHQLFLPNLSDDIALGPLAAGKSSEDIFHDVATALDNLQLTELKDRSPFDLSMGEQKRAALASVLVMKPDIILFDEPTANLDPAGRRAFIKLVNSLTQTLIIAGHDLDMIYALCDRVVIMDGGRIVAEGQTENILGDALLLAAHRLELPLSLELARYRQKFTLN